MEYNNFIIDKNSNKINQVSQINILLKEHQLSSIYRALEIEKFKLFDYGIMNDKPGSGKTYTILGFIFHSGLKNNLIVVPQNLITQWTQSIINFSDGLLTFKKILNYSDIIEFYDEENQLFDKYHIYLTSSLYYHSLCTTFNSYYLKMNRIFFDEIDSISNILVHKMNADFIWFVSASFDFQKTGAYHIDSLLMNNVIVKCNDDFIKESFNMEEYIEYKIICKNFYLDNIFKNVIEDDEITLLNALDYSNLKRKFHSKIASNELEAITYLIKDKKEIIEIEQLRIEDLEKSILKTENETKKKDLIKILEKSKKNVVETQEKLDLIKLRLKENDCCPLCYEELKNKKKVISPCCQNNICYVCAENWFSNLEKTSCLYCNTENVKLEHYVLVKNCENEVEDEEGNIVNITKCTICDVDIINENECYYSSCCEKIGCTSCIKEWFLKLLKKECLFCHNKEILYDDFKNKSSHDEMSMNIKNGIKYINKSKLQFIEHFLMTKTHKNSKIIFCSQFPKIFNDLTKLLVKYNIAFIELDNGNIDDIDKNVYEYIYGNIHVLLMNSNLFGCGLNLENSTDILFLHKTGHELQTQIIGRAQRPGRKNKLNVWFLMHENEHYYQEKKNSEIVINDKNDVHTIEIIQDINDEKMTLL